MPHDARIKGEDLLALQDKWRCIGDGVKKFPILTAQFILLLLLALFGIPFNLLANLYSDMFA